MALDLYLALVDNAGATIPGQGAPVPFSNPFRGNVAITRPFAVRSYSFGGEMPVSAGGGTAGRVQIGELEIDMPDDAAADTMFGNLIQNRRMRSADLLAVTQGTRPTVVAGVGVNDAVIARVSWAGDGSGIVRRLTIDGRTFCVGSATQRRDGVYERFSYFSYDTTGTPN